VRTGNKWAISVPRNTYQTSDGHWLALSGSSPELALRVFDAIGRPELRDDPEFSEPLRRVANRHEVDGLVADWVRSLPLDEVLRRFDEQGVAAGPVYDAEQLMNDPQMIARNTFVPVPDEDLGVVRVQAPVARLSDSPGRIDHLGRNVGEDNDYVYGKFLDLPADNISALQDAGII
jgi:crotonobetainyl-CoA:carnitine CoA-transferase CaiB-like acyl-CoA transferase